MAVAILLLVLSACFQAISTADEPPISILLWSTSHWLNWGQKRFINTSLGACEILHNRSDIAKAEVVFFLWQWFNETEIPPIPRPRGAMWVYASHESPADDKRAHPEVVKRMNGMINVLMTYDTVANVSFKYGMTAKRDTMLDALPPEITMARPGNTIDGTTAYAVMVEGNCHSKDRNYKVKELQKHFKIDIMGRCGTVKHKECDARDPACFDILAKTYYFYIAIENSECPDYITEKVWRNSLEAGMVPIVWSDKVDYERLLPPNSYINVADFADVASFAEYIQQVQVTPSLFRKHQEWRYTCSPTLVSMELEGQRLCEYAIRNDRHEQPAIDLQVARHCWNQSD